jgi:hypothetical protein
MKLKHFSLLFSVIGILILYLLSRVSQPISIDINEIQNYEGKQVIVRGIVKDHYETKHGSQIIKIEGNNTTLSIYIEGKKDIEYGDKIQATGEVQKFQDEWELVINDGSDVKILRKWNNISIPLRQLAKNPTKYLDTNVNITGYIESISNSYFYLVDFENKHALLVYYILSKNVTIYPGQRICVSGLFSFDEENFRYKLDICDEKHSVIPIQQE